MLQSDIVKREELPSDKEVLLKKLEEEGVTILEMSTLKQTGVIQLRDKVRLAGRERVFTS